MAGYFKNISQGIGTTLKGMSLTWRHLWQARKRRMSTDIRSSNFFDLQSGMVTIQYPQETVPIPDNGRYRLHNEMDDCIVCDKCVKVCPVDCIEIEPIRAIEEVGKASDGSPIRLYAAKFDIDMAKCCYCGLCTTVCPTECLTMTKTFDYSELDVRDMVYNYANISPEIAEEKRALFDQFQKEKEALKAAQKPATASEVTPASPAVRPTFKPTIKPKQPEIEVNEVEAKEETSIKPAKPVFQPKKPAPASEIIAKEEVEPPKVEEKAAPKIPFRPSMKPKVDAALEASEEVAPINPVDSEKPVSEVSVEPKPTKPAFRPTMKPKTETAINPIDPENPVNPFPIVEEPVSKLKSEENIIKAEDIAKAEDKPIAEKEEIPKPKLPFRPTMKPKPKQE